MRLGKSKTTFLCFREVLIIGIPFKEIEKIWEIGVFLILNVCYQISNLRDSIYNKIVNGCSKSLIFTVRLSSSLRRSNSWDLIYCRDLFDRFKIGTGVSAEMIYFVIWNKKHRLIRCNTMKLFVRRRIRVRIWSIG